VLRPYLLARREELPVSATLATIVLERVLDLLAVLLLLFAYIWGFAASAGPERFRPVVLSAVAVGTGAAGLLAAMWTLASHPERLGRFVLAGGRRLPAGLARRLARIAESFSGGFAVSRRPRELLLAMAWSVPLWVAIAGEVWAVTRALDIDLPFSGAFL